MDTKLFRIAGSGLTALAGIFVLVWWLAYDPVQDLVMHVPGMDGRPADLQQGPVITRIGSYFKASGAVAFPAPGSWPRFRGQEYDNISREGFPLAEEWPPEGPPVLWQVQLGEGHAGPVVLNDRVYLLDYDEEQKQELLRCFSLADGRELWRRGHPLFLKRNHGVSRTVPAVTEEYVVTLGPFGHVMCVDAISGDFRWGIDLVQEYDAVIPQWYTAQCPLIDGDTVVLAPAGTALLICADLAGGGILWQSPNPGGWQMSHASVMPMILDGRRMYVYSALGGVAGISAEPEDRGIILWENREWNNSVVAPSPVVFPDGRIFLTAGYGAGSMMIRVSAVNGEYKTEVLYSHSPREGLACEQQTPILYRDHLFGILPRDAGPDRTQFVCYNPGGSLVWASGKTRQFDLGPYLLADEKFYILNDDGQLIIARASLSGYEELDRTRVLQGRDAWAPLAVTEGKMLLRDSTTMVCIDIRAQ